jgi:hypothetical protein
MTPVEQARIVASEGLRHARHSPDFARRDQQMHMVAHQHIRVQPASVTGQRLAETLQIALPVPVVEETRHAIVAALHQMLGNAGKIGTR